MKAILALAITMATLAPLGAQPVKVGTFSKPAIVVAYYRSQLWMHTLQSNWDEMKAAKAANDTAKIEQLNKWGGSQQEIAHKQLSGDAPLTNILEALSPAFPTIAQKAQVSVVASGVLFTGTGVEKVDVTDLILDWLKADDQTRKMIRDIPGQ